jgi:3-isopropylmalate dehydratase small subunit
MTEPFTTLTGIAAPLLRDDINTDQISPIQRASTLHPDYAALLFSRWRKRADGSEDADFVLNRPRFRAAKILVTGRNFGCGASREAAIWGLLAHGIRCIVARGFAEIFRENCLRNGLLPVVLAEQAAAGFETLVTETDGGAPFTVDLARRSITCPDGATFPFDIPPADRHALLEGLDHIAMTLEHRDAIKAWERDTRVHQPWLQTLPK